MPARSGSLPPSLLVAACLAAQGCSSLRDGSRAAPTVRPVAVNSADRSDTAEPMPTPASAMAEWAERQRFIFARAWREMRQDLEYETIDSFGNLDGEARRDVLAMRGDLVSERDAIDTRRRAAADRSE